VKKARNQSQIFKREPISCNTTQRHSFLSSASNANRCEKYKGQHKVRENTTSRLQWKQRTDSTPTNKTKPNQNVLLNYMQSLKPPDSLHKSQERTKTQRQVTINTKW